MTQILADLKARDLIFQVTNEKIDSLFQSDKPPVYCGVDPTGSSLHVGHLLPIIGLMRFQMAGFKPLVLIGGATGMIGDPSGKSSERILLNQETIEENVNAIGGQLQKFLDFDKGRCSAQIVNNYEWFRNYPFIAFLRDIGKHFSLGTILAKESVKARLEAGISFTEFSYILMQSYDFLHLFDTYGCRIQIGGQDQWGNITAGIDLIRKLRGIDVFGVTFPLITATSGKKFGKSEAGTVWLNENLTTPYQLYQYLINTSDDDVIKFLNFYTFLSLEEINGCAEAVRNRPERRESQKLLAKEVTGLVHGKKNAELAEKASKVFFGGELSDFDDKALEEIFPDVPKAHFSPLALSEGLDLIQVLLSCQAVSSKGEARRLLKQGGVYVNNNKVKDLSYMLTTKDLASKHFILVRTGKKKFFLLRID